MARDGELREILEQREREYVLSKTKVRMRSSLENIQAGDYKIEKFSEGDLVELPRWVAEELAQLSLVESSEEPFETEIFKAVSKEKMMGPFQLSTLSPEFYLRMRRRVNYLDSAAREGRVNKFEYDKLRGICYDLVGMRLSKLLSLSSSSTKPEDLGDKVTPEEKAFFVLSKSVTREWKDSLLGVGM